MNLFQLSSIFPLLDHICLTSGWGVIPKIMRFMSFCLDVTKCLPDTSHNPNVNQGVENGCPLIDTKPIQGCLNLKMRRVRGEVILRRCVLHTTSLYFRSSSHLLQKMSKGPQQAPPRVSKCVAAKMEVSVWNRRWEMPSTTTANSFTRDVTVRLVTQDAFARTISTHAS